MTENFDEIKAFLHDKGFDERTLKCPEPKGTFFKDLKEAIKVAQHEISVGDRPPSLNSDIKVEAEIYGVFAYTDIAHFSFEFAYNPDRNQLSLEKVTGVLNHERSGVSYDSTELPHSQEFYKELKVHEKNSLETKRHNETVKRHQKLAH